MEVDSLLPQSMGALAPTHPPPPSHLPSLSSKLPACLHAHHACITLLILLLLLLFLHLLFFFIHLFHLLLLLLRPQSSHPLPRHHRSYDLFSCPLSFAFIYWLMAVLRFLCSKFGLFFDLISLRQKLDLIFYLII